MFFNSFEFFLNFIFLKVISDSLWKMVVLLKIFSPPHCSPVGLAPTTKEIHISHNLAKLFHPHVAMVFDFKRSCSLQTGKTFTEEYTRINRMWMCVFPLFLEQKKPNIIHCKYNHHLLAIERTYNHTTIRVHQYTIHTFHILPKTLVLLPPVRCAYMTVRSGYNKVVPGVSSKGGAACCVVTPSIRHDIKSKFLTFVQKTQWIACWDCFFFLARVFCGISHGYQIANRFFILAKFSTNPYLSGCLCVFYYR